MEYDSVERITELSNQVFDHYAEALQTPDINESELKDARYKAVITAEVLASVVERGPWHKLLDAAMTERGTPTRFSERSPKVRRMYLDIACYVLGDNPVIKHRGTFSRDEELITLLAEDTARGRMQS